MHRPRNMLIRWQLRGLLLVLLTASPVMAQTAQENALSLSISYIAESQIFTSPASPDPSERTLTTDIGSAVAWSLQYRRALVGAVFVETSLEYTTAETSWSDAYGTTLRDGYHAYIAEVSGLFALPFSGKVIQVLVGGGGGVYLGERRLQIASAVAEHAGNAPVFGIHVLFSVEWRLLPDLSLRGDARFRDPQMSVENRFTRSSVTSNGVEYPLPTTPFPGDINLHGNVYGVGLVYRF